MLYLMGMGLRGARSLTLEEVDILKRSDSIFLEIYTSVIGENIQHDIEKLTGKSVSPVNRNDMEYSDIVTRKAHDSIVSLLVSGDPLMATTHNVLRVKCMDLGIKVSVLENASILNTAVGYSGLSPYKVAPPVSIPRVSDKFFPLSVYKKIAANLREKRHTVLLLDTGDGNPMTLREAMDVLFRMEEESSENIISESTLIICAIRVGFSNERYIMGSMGAIRELNIRDSPAIMILPSDMDENEREFTERFCDRISQ